METQDFAQNAIDKALRSAERIEKRVYDANALFNSGFDLVMDAVEMNVGKKELDSFMHIINDNDKFVTLETLCRSFFAAGLFTGEKRGKKAKRDTDKSK